MEIKEQQKGDEGEKQKKKVKRSSRYREESLPGVTFFSSSRNSVVGSLLKSAAMALWVVIEATVKRPAIVIDVSRFT